MTSRRCTWIAWLVVAGCSGAPRIQPEPAKPNAPAQTAPAAPAPSPSSPSPPAQPDRTLPIWIHPVLELSSAADAAAKLEAADPLGFGALEHAGTTITPKTCAERDRLKARGFEPATTVEIQPDSWAEVSCKTLRLLVHAQPSRASFVPSTLEPSLISMLPAALATATSNDRLAERDAATRAGLSLKQFEPRAHGRTDQDGMLVIRETGLDTSINLELQARGDFDADGNEDVALSVLNSADHGSWTEMRLFVLTRTTPAASLTVVP
jgi:hypothetical protein